MSPYHLREHFLRFWVLLLLPVFAAAQNRPPPPTPRISDFVLYAERSIRMGHRSHTEGGQVGVRTAIAQERKGSAQLQLEEHAKCGTAFSPSMSLENDAEVGEIWTDSLKRVKDTELGPQGSFPATLMPPLPLASASGSGQDINVEEHKTRSITPGTYGVVNIEDHGTLRLTAGTYTFASVKMGGDTKILGERGGVDTRASGLDVRIVHGLQMGEEAKIAGWRKSLGARVRLPPLTSSWLSMWKWSSRAASPLRRPDSRVRSSFTGTSQSIPLPTPQWLDPFPQTPRSPFLSACRYKIQPAWRLSCSRVGSQEPELPQAPDAVAVLHHLWRERFRLPGP